MCGISVLISKKEGVNLDQQVQSMNDKIVHRGPDAEGKFIHKNIALGHRRLSILDLSSNSNQPFKYGKYVVVFNGEIYNYIELRDELKQYGYQFVTNSDTEVIPAAFDQWGEDCLERFNGMWSFALLDTETDSLFFSRDRYGIKPLYFYENDKSIVFCS